MSSPGAGQSGTSRVHVMGFGRRAGAMIIDGVIVAFFSFVVAFAIGFIGVTINMFRPTDGNAGQPLIIGAAILFSLIYYVGSWATMGQTIGKSTFGMTILDKNGGKLTWGRAILRYVGYAVSSLLMGLGFLWVAFDGKRQGFHDKIAGTYVSAMDDDVVPGTRAEFVAADPGRGWGWLILWIVLAIGTPVGAIASWFAFGPALSRMLVGWWGG